MLEQLTLELAEAQAAVDAVITAAGEAGHRGVAVSVVDRSGEVIAMARMDGVAPRTGKAAGRKAYTGAVMEHDTAAVIKFWDMQATRGHRGPSDWNDAMVTTLPGGFAVCHGDQVVGGLGVAGGNQQMSDQEFAEIGMKALGESFRHRPDWD